MTYQYTLSLAEDVQKSNITVYDYVLYSIQEKEGSFASGTEYTTAKICDLKSNHCIAQRFDTRMTIFVLIMLKKKSCKNN